MPGGRGGGAQMACGPSLRLDEHHGPVIYWLSSSCYLSGFAGALGGTFAWALPVAVVGFVLALALRELPLRGRPGSGATSEANDGGVLVLDHA